MTNSGLTVIYFQEVSESLPLVMNNTMYDYNLLTLAHRFRTYSFSGLVERNHSLRVKKSHKLPLNGNHNSYSTSTYGNQRCDFDDHFASKVILKLLPLVLQSDSNLMLACIAHTVHCCPVSCHCPRYIPFFWHSLSTAASRDNSQIT